MHNDPALRLIIVTGLSGSGKSIAIRQLEDSGYYCVDNLPAEFLSAVVEHLREHDRNHIAVAIDARSQTTSAALEKQVGLLCERGWDVRALFLTASTPALIQRYSETRRRHPLSVPNISGVIGVTLAEAIDKERDLLAASARGAHVIDTSGLLPNTLRDWVRQFADAPRSLMTVAFESFAFKRGIPVAADLVYDVRNLPNPYYDPALRPFTGQDAPVAEFLDNSEQAQAMLKDIEQFIRRWLPSYEAQNRHYLTIAIGCTGGQHRSVYVAEQLAKRFHQTTNVVLRHRQMAQQKNISQTR